MKFSLLLSLLLTFTISSYSQDNKRVPVPSNYQVITAQIKGHKGEKVLPYSAISDGFQLQLSDTTFKVKSYRLSWDSNDGNKYLFAMLTDSVNASTTKDKFGQTGGMNYLSFDTIVAVKNGKEYKIPGLVINIR